MKVFLPRSLRVILPLLLCVVALLVGAFNMWRSVQWSINEMESNTLRSVSQRMTELQGALESFLRKGEMDDVQERISSTGSDPNIILALADDNDIVVAATSPKLIGRPITIALPEVNTRMVTHTRHTMTGKATLSSDRSAVYGCYPVHMGVKTVGGVRSSRIGFLHMSYNLANPKAATRRSIVYQTLVTTSFYASLFLLLAIYLHFVVTRRASGLVAAARRFSLGDLSSRAGLGGKDELSEISRAFDIMAEKIEHDTTSLKENVAGAENEKAKSEAIIAALSDGISIQDRTFRVLFQNPVAEKTFGRHVGEFCYKGYRGRETPCENCPVALCFADGKVHTMESAFQGDKHIYVDMTAAPLRDATGAVVGAIEVVHDITDRKKAEKHLRKEALRGEVLLELYEGAPRLTEKELYDYALDHVVSLTDSVIGFLHLVSDDQKSIILTTWNNQALKNCTASYATHYPIDEAGNWVDCVRLKRPIIYNDFENSPNRKGLPDGHTAVRRFMSIPVMEGEKVRIIFGVGNKVEEYDDHDVVHIQLVANELQKIVRQRHAEGELQSSQQKLTNVLSHFPGVVFWKDRHSVYIGCNRNFSSGAGLGPEEIVGKTDYDLPWAKTEADAYRADDRLVVESALPKLNIVETQLQADGSIVWFDTNKVPLFDPEGNVIGVLGTSNDITQRKRAEEELERYQEHLEDLVAERTSELAQSISLLSATIESTTDGILVVSRTGKIVNSNKKFAEMWHIPEEVIASGDDDHALACVLDQLSSPDEFIVKVRELYSQPEAESLDILHFKNGDVFERYSRPQRIDSQIVGRVWSFRDITARKQAEETLQENAYFLQTLMDAIPNPIFFKDVNGVYQACNTAFESYLGLSKSEIAGKSVYDIAPRELADRYHEMDMALLRQGGVQVYESSVRYADGTLHDVIFNKATYFNTGGSVSGLVGVILDITARKKAENELHWLNEVLEQKVNERTKQLLDAQEELVRKEKLSILGQLAGIVGHEIRNPLAVINNAVFFLKTVMTDADETVREYLDIIKNEIGNSQRIITDLLDFSRTKTPQFVLVTVNALATQALGRCIIPENVAVRTDIPDTLPEVNVDPFQIGQVLQNLITNAVQATPGGGTMVIAARHVARCRLQVASSEQGKGDHPIPSPFSPMGEEWRKDCEPVTCNVQPATEFIEISVTDTGEGISPENMEKLFQPLFTTKTKGIGLGLTVCKNLVEANGGRIMVESEIGRRTTFSVVLPLGGNDE